MMRALYLVLLVSCANAQEESTGSASEELESSTLRPKPFTFRPEVLRKFRVVLKRIFNFDELFNTPPNALFTFPQNQQQSSNPFFTFSQNQRQPFAADQGTNQQAPPQQISQSVRPSDRELLEETAEVPDTNQQNPFEQRRRYEQYWRDYYYRQQQQNQFSPYGSTGNQWYQQQQYSPYSNYGNQQQYSPYGGQNYYYQQQQQQQQQYSPYYNQQNGFNIGSGLNIGLPNGLGFGINSGMGISMGR